MQQRALREALFRVGDSMRRTTGRTWEYKSALVGEATSYASVEQFTGMQCQWPYLLQSKRALNCSVRRAERSTRPSVILPTS